MQAGMLARYKNGSAHSSQAVRRCDTVHTLQFVNLHFKNLPPFICASKISPGKVAVFNAQTTVELVTGANAIERSAGYWLTGQESVQTA